MQGTMQAISALHTQLVASKTRPQTEKPSTALTGNPATKTTSPVAQPESTAYGQALLRFGGLINKDRSVELRQKPINAATAFQILRSLMLQDLVKTAKNPKDQSSIKLYLGALSSDKYVHQDQAALADIFGLMNRPVDVVLKSGVGSDCLKTIMSASGKRLGYPGMELMMGPFDSSSPNAKNKDAQVRRNLFNTYLRDTETLVMRRTGETNRNKVFQDLMSGKDYNALQSLSYGQHGLIDAILVGYDRVITRDDLEAYYKEQGFDAASKEAFNRDYLNIYKVTKTTALKDFSPASVPGDTYSHYQTPKEPAKPDAKGDEKADVKPDPPKIAGIPVTDDAPPADKTPEAPAEKPGEKTAEKSTDKQTEKPAEAEKPVFTLYSDGKKTTDFGLAMKAGEGGSPKRMLMTNLPASKTLNGILHDDTIFFNDGFEDKTAEQIVEGLLALDDKKAEQKHPTNIKILENSPGGSVWSGQEIRSTIRSLRTPVDVIVQGMGASCGSWLLSSASGNRFATPNARVMIHEAANSMFKMPGNLYNEGMDGLNQATKNYVGIVAEATGLPFERVWEDFKLDVWFNPLESLFYGPKGLIDGVLVSGNEVITRQDVTRYLKDKLGSDDKVERYVAQKLEEKRHPSMDWQATAHNENDAFDNPLTVLAEITAAKRAADDTKIPQKLAKSFPPASNKQPRTIDYLNVVLGGKPGL